MAVQYLKTRVFLLAALAAAAGSLLAKDSVDSVNGVGLITVPESAEYPKGLKVFDPTHVYATRSSEPARIWILVTDRDASAVEWRKAADRSDVLRAWCETDSASFLLFELDTKGVPEMMYSCGGSGALSTAMISTWNGLASVSPTFEELGDKHIRGRILMGSGWCGDDTYCEKNGDLMFEVEVR